MLARVECHEPCKQRKQHKQCKQRKHIRHRKQSTQHKQSWQSNQSNAKQNKAKQSKTKQSKAKQTTQNKTIKAIKASKHVGQVASLGLLFGLEAQPVRHHFAVAISAAAWLDCWAGSWDGNRLLGFCRWWHWAAEPRWPPSCHRSGGHCMGIASFLWLPLVPPGPRHTRLEVQVTSPLPVQSVHGVDSAKQPRTTGENCGVPGHIGEQSKPLREPLRKGGERRGPVRLWHSCEEAAQDEKDDSRGP